MFRICYFRFALTNTKRASVISIESKPCNCVSSKKCFSAWPLDAATLFDSIVETNGLVSSFPFQNRQVRGLTFASLLRLSNASAWFEASSSWCNRKAIASCAHIFNMARTLPHCYCHREYCLCCSPCLCPHNPYLQYFKYSQSLLHHFYRHPQYRSPKPLQACFRLGFSNELRATKFILKANFPSPCSSIFTSPSRNPCSRHFYGLLSPSIRRSRSNKLKNCNTYMYSISFNNGATLDLCSTLCALLDAGFHRCYTMVREWQSSQ